MLATKHMEIINLFTGFKRFILTKQYAYEKTNPCSFYQPDYH